MLKNEVITKILGKVMLKTPDIDQLKLRDILEEVLYNYQVTSKSQEIAVINDVQDKVVLFLASKKIEGLSSKSLYNYKLQLARFSSYIQKDIDKIDAMDIRMFIATISKENNLNQTSISTLISILKSFFGWLESEEYIIKNPMKKIKQPKKQKNLRKALSIEQIEMLRGGCKTLRQKSLLEFLFATGCRVSEVVNVNIKDLNFTTYSLKVLGKGSKEREVYFSAKTKIHLQKYLLSRCDNNEALFVSSKEPHNRLGVRSIQRELKVIANNAGLDVSVYPHLLRHSMATTALNSGVSLVSLQNILGHEDPGTTQIYGKVNNEDVKNEYRKYMTV